ncbi:peptidase M50 family protein [Gordonia polyisoprenivorans NBRC 16320 = JCM 10675]|uniref:Site-2 protease family protein n=1 Tax=Gordonia polyisoprenivorans TaxID=84595 RepID=A0A846WJ73_9ACTN|nr:site-2 protease family protein [Gordonia polyisoprenivorans]NKY01765.1 site-2 protease family protein [Gordonia polyisoprenivorans]GAB25174.1 peptidase M50 family protein [Gordonia polyisoprenivorans NBRC 16320 = JCM 10675]
MTGPAFGRRRNPTMTEMARAIQPGVVFFALIAVAVLGGWLAATAGSDRSSGKATLGVILLVLAGWVISLCLHEFGHAVTAYRFGDRDAELRGYLTLNPLRYTHPGLSLGLPLLIILLGGIGFPGGAVYLNERGFTKAQRTIVSLAGPACNILLAVVLLGVIRGFGPFVDSPIGRLLTSSDSINLWDGLAMLAFLQITAAVLNLIPMPGFDGYNAIEPYLSPQTRQSAAAVAPYGFLLIFALLFIPQLNKAFFDLIFWLFELSGVPSGLAEWGWDTFLFWRR